MTLNKINVKDFQSIQSGEVELGSFTVFTGPSSSGKSSFMRAAQALVRNGFTPSQVRQGAKECHVTLTFDDHTVEAIRGKAKSTYILDGDEYNKAGRAVPPEVAEALALEEISETESTFSTQFDKPYLIAEPGSTAAKVLGSLTNVSILHSSLKEANRRALERKSLLRTREADMQATQDQLAEFLEVDALRAQVEEAEELLAVLDAFESKQSSLVVAIENISRLAKALVLIRQQIVEVPDAIELETASTQLETASQINELVVKVDRLRSQIPQEDYSSLEGVDLDFGDVDKIHSLQRAVGALPQLVSRYQAAAKSYKEATSNIEASQVEYDTILRDAKVCPLCGNELHGGRID